MEPSADVSRRAKAGGPGRPPKDPKGRGKQVSAYLLPRQIELLEQVKRDRGIKSDVEAIRWVFDSMKAAAPGGELEMLDIQRRLEEVEAAGARRNRVLEAICREIQRLVREDEAARGDDLESAE